MKREKRVKGFTLVELIVVIAIIGVLAAILVPSMLGYVNKAKHSSMNSSAKSLFDAAMVACREGEVVKPMTSGVYTSTNYSGEDGMINDDIFDKCLYEFFASAKEVRWAVRIRDDVPVGAAIQKRAGDSYIGTYPHANNEKHDDDSMVAAVNYGETGTWSMSNENESP